MANDVTADSELDEHLLKTTVFDTTSTRYFMSQPDIRLNIILMSLSWLASSFNYYMVGFLLKYFPGSIYVNGSISSLSELAAGLTAGLIYAKFGVKKSLVISFGIAAVGGFGILWYEIATDFYSGDQSDVSSFLFPTLVLFAKFGISLAFTINYLSNLDLFPVLFAATALGFCNFLARLFTIFSPEVAEIQSLLPMILFASLSIVTMFTSMFLRVQAPQKPVSHN